jgi:hypothetical protein
MRQARGKAPNAVATACAVPAPAELPAAQGASAAAEAEDVLRQVAPPCADQAPTLRLLGEGAQSVVFAATLCGQDPTGEEHHLLAIKLYRPSIARELVARQFEAFRDLHAVLDGRRIGRWTFAVPQPLLLCEAPLALVTTVARGRTLLQHLEVNESNSGADFPSAARAVSDAMMTCWSQGFAYGDLNLDNILCDFESQTLSFLDPGTAVLPPYMEPPPDGWRLGSHDLAYLLFENVTTLLRSMRYIGAERRKQNFATEIMRHVLRAIPVASERRRLLEEVRTCAGAYLAMLEAAWTPRGLWRAILRRIGRRRIGTLLDTLQAEFDLGGT